MRLFLMTAALEVSSQHRDDERVLRLDEVTEEEWHIPLHVELDDVGKDTPALNRCHEVSAVTALGPHLSGYFGHVIHVDGRGNQHSGAISALLPRAKQAQVARTHSQFALIREVRNVRVVPQPLDLHANTAVETILRQFTTTAGMLIQTTTPKTCRGADMSQQRRNKQISQGQIDVFASSLRRRQCAEPRAISSRSHVQARTW